MARQRTKIQRAGLTALGAADEAADKLADAAREVAGRARGVVEYTADQAERRRSGFKRLLDGLTGRGREVTTSVRGRTRDPAKAAVTQAKSAATTAKRSARVARTAGKKAVTAARKAGQAAKVGAEATADALRQS